MGAWSRWKRRYNTAKKASRKVKGWFTEDPISSTHKKTMVSTAKPGVWESVKLSQASKYPEPKWLTLESGLRVYGPVRKKEGDWGFFDAEGNQIYSKKDKMERDGTYTPTAKGLSENRKKELQKKYPAPFPVAATATSKKRITRCGKKRADGKKCRVRGNCPHHRNHIR